MTNVQKFTINTIIKKGVGVNNFWKSEWWLTNYVTKLLKTIILQTWKNSSCRKEATVYFSKFALILLQKKRHLQQQEDKNMLTTYIRPIFCKVSSTAAGFSIICNIKIILNIHTYTLPRESNLSLYVACCWYLHHHVTTVLHTTLLPRVVGTWRHNQATAWSHHEWCTSSCLLKLKASHIHLK
jgi:hypothetical protein